MHPRDIIDHPRPPGQCYDCDQPAVVTEQTEPMCLMHARLLMPLPVDQNDLATCLACLFSYKLSDWNRCPNDACPTNRGSVYDDLRMEGDDIDPEAYFDMEGDDAPL